jgi:N-acetylmuramoyl-L-alanine amidase
MKYRLLFLLLLASLSSIAQEPFYGRTTGRLPYLEYGTGDDRLGGAKLGYLDSNILLKVVDSTADDYKVQLSSAHAAYFPKNSFRRDTAIKPRPSYLTGSWKVWGDSVFDYVSVSLPERLPYASRQEIGPSRIVIDVFGATSNTNWITQLKTVKEVANAWYEQPENDVFRIMIDLKHQQHWGYLIYYRNNTLIIRVKRQPASLRPKKLRIAIDAGHGGSNAGASGLTSKVSEKEYTLKIAKQVERYLKRKGYDVYMTRTSDVDINMTDRTMALREAAPDLLLSIHLNSAGNASVRGVSTYYRYIGFRPLSQAILDRMLELGLSNFGNIGAFNFSLSGPTEYPNCLLEVAFLSNAEDEKKILRESFQKNVAKKVYKGLRDWLRSL